MPEKVSPGPLRGNPMPREAVCIHTKKVYDSCKEKECLQDLRVFLTCRSQELLENAISVKAKSAELLLAYIDVEPITFNRGFYTVDVKYFYHITAEACSALGRPRELSGIATYNKRTVLFGSEGNVRIFSSNVVCDGSDVQHFEQSNLPIAVIEAVDPVILEARIQENMCCTNACTSCCGMEIPAEVCGCLDDELVVSDDGKQLLVTLGQFSIIRLERDIQLLMPAYDICLPEKECVGCTEDPCSLFENFTFPVDEFYPPKMNGAVHFFREKPCNTVCHSCQNYGNGCNPTRRH